MNTCNVAELTEALHGFDAVVNCVAGDARSISDGMRALVEAALSANCPRIIHLSTMSLYGPIEEVVQENAPLNPGFGWYGSAKCKAEQRLGEFVRRGAKTSYH